MIITAEDIDALEALYDLANEAPGCSMPDCLVCPRNKKVREEARKVITRMQETQRVCQACRIEAEIGTEENPHPVPRRFHTCVE